MKNVLKGFFVLSMSVGFSFLQPIGIEAQSADTPASRAAHPAGVTAEDQGKAESDVEMTAKIRREIMAKETLSIRAKNIKIITMKGKVVLKGEVANGDERTALLGIATTHAGSENVKDEMVLKTR